MRAALRLWAVIVMLALAFPALAQEGLTDADYAEWDRLATRIEQSVSDGNAGAETLAADRQRVADWRDRLQAAQKTNAARITGLREQISALGPSPAEGETEAEDVAARRKQLTAQLAQLQAPGLKAVEAASRANAIIQSIDQLQRNRQATELLHQSPSPLLPSSVGMAVRDGTMVLVGLATEVAGRAAALSADDWRRNTLRVGALLAAALLLLIQGRRWVGRLPQQLSAQASESSRDAVAFIVSLAQIAIPVLGVYLAALALDQTGLFGPWWRPILTALPMAGLTFFVGAWLSRMFFPALLPCPIAFSDKARARGRWSGTLLAAVTALHQIAANGVLQLSGLRMDEAANTGFPVSLDEAGAGVWHLPLIVLGALLLFRLGSILRKAVVKDTAEPPLFRVRVTAIIGMILRPLSVLIVLAALVGYVTLANGLLWPAVQTLALLMFLTLLQEFITDLYGMVLRNQETGRNALLPVLIGFMLVLASVPVFALIWGARRSDLAEAWVRLRGGVAVGGIQLSPGAIMTFLIVFTIGYMITRMVQGALRSSILPRTRIDAGGQNAIVSGLGYLGIILASVFAVTAAGIDLSNLAIVAGALSVGIGFGMQNIVSNFVSGIILLIERPIAIGDWISVKGAEGTVRRISVRSTQIQTFDRSDVIVPNSDLIANPVTNFTRGNAQGRIIVAVSVAYESDTRKVARILREIAEDQPTVMITPPPMIAFRGFGADGLDFELRCILSDINQSIGVQTEIRHQIVERFRAEGVEMPFAHRDINIRSAEGLDEALRRTLAVQRVSPARPSAPVPSPQAEDDLPDRSGADFEHMDKGETGAHDGALEGSDARGGGRSGPNA